MAIIAPQTAPNFAHGEYFKILREELICSPLEPNPRKVIYVGFYANEYAREQAPGRPMYTHAMEFPISEMIAAGLPDPRVESYAMLMRSPLFAGTNAAPDVTAQRTAEGA